MRLSIYHSSSYRFSDPVSFGLQQVRKTPKASAAQEICDWSTQVVGGTKQLSFADHHGNTVELISFDKDATEVEIISQGQIEASDTHGVLGAHRGPAPLWLYTKPTASTKAGQGTRALAKGIDRSEPLPMLHELSARIRDQVPYQIGFSQPDWSAEEAISQGGGVCQDHTHIFLAAARYLGLPARYVSGYLMLDDRTCQEAMHAWAEAHLPGLGWVGFDVSNGISPDHRYVRVATGLDYAEAAPISGMRVGAGSETLHVNIKVAQQ